MRLSRWGMLAAAFAMMIGVATARSAPTTATINPDAPRLVVGRVSIRYLSPIEGAPLRQDIIANVTVNLHRVRAGYTAPLPGGPSLPYQFNEPVLHNARFSLSAIRLMQDAVRQYVNDQGLFGVFVYAAPATAADTDNGPPGLNYAAEADNSKPLDIQLIIVLGVVKEVRVTSVGPRVNYPMIGPKSDPLARHIKKDSPIQSGQPLTQQKLTEYTEQLNRQPGRHVDATIVAAENGKEGDVDLDYVIRYDKPWSVFLRSYNGGTKKTNEWQEQFGFVDNELTGHDDVLTADFNTASFSNTYTLDASYDFPIWAINSLRARIYGSAGRFDSSNLGIADESLIGDDTEFGAEGVLNVLQTHSFFLDLVGGAKIDNYFVNVSQPEAGGSVGDSDAAFLLPYVGVRLSRATDLAATSAQFEAEFDPQTPSSPDSNNLQGLGRLEVDHHFMILQGTASQSFYIEPLLEGWDERDTQSRPTAANEMYLSVQGQFTPEDKRLAPELEGTAGGLYSVRGYPSSVVAGDSVVYATAEYRVHIPRLLAISSSNTLMGQSVPPPPLVGDNGSFYYQPRAVDTPGDWDLIAKGFVDGGYVHDNNRQDDTGRPSDAGLLSIGPGVELDLRNNLTFLCDYGVTLTPIRHQSSGVDVDRGASRVDIVITLLY